ANTEKINMVTLPLGLACIAQATRDAGHETAIVDLVGSGDDMSGLDDALRGGCSDVVGISVRNIDDLVMQGGRFLLERTRDVVQRCKQLSTAPVVLGGAGYSIFPEHALRYLGADLGIQGEGETAFPLLLDKIQHGGGLSGVAGLYVNEGSSVEKAYDADLDSHALPEKDVWSPPAAEDQEIWMPVQTRRGCPMGCSYCSTPAIEGHVIRKRSPSDVAHWIRHWVEEGYGNFFFVDNTFNLPTSYAKQLCREIKSNAPGIKWRCIVYPYKVDEELVALMAEAGCVQVSLGFESGSDRMLRALKKKFSPDDIVRSVGLLKDNRISIMGFLLLGGPGETMQTVHESLSFADSLSLQAVKVTAGIRIYPDTPLAWTA
ncbi:hypothetical protein LCGC14_2954390, partial [marine sediment metagenome]